MAVHPYHVHNVLGKHIITDGFLQIPDLKKSHNSRMVDKLTGNMYMDCFSQFASQPLGWNNSYMKAQKHRMDAVTEHKIANSDMYTPEYAEFVDTFASIAKDFKHFFFIDGGALAVENALKAAFDWKANKMGSELGENPYFDVVHLKEAFHGRTGYTLSITNTESNKIAGFPKFCWTRINNPKMHIVGQTEEELIEAENESLHHCKTAMERGCVAAIILEPVQGEGGDNHFRKEYLQSLRALADEYEAMLIFDEVQTGIGLTGKWWAYEHFDVIPDMIAFGKKSQVCGFASTTRIDEVENHVFNTSGRINSTWGGNLVDMVRSTIIIEFMKSQKVVDSVDRVGKYLMKKLSTLPFKNVRGKGLMVAFDPENRESFMEKISKKMIALKCGKESIRLRPPLTFTENDADYVYEILRQASI